VVEDEEREEDGQAWETKISRKEKTNTRPFWTTRTAKHSLEAACDAPKLLAVDRR